MPGLRRQAVWLTAALATLAVAGVEVVPFWRGARFSDLLVAHLPSALFLNRSLRVWGEIPLWNPTLLGGLPFAADPLSGLWYPPLWLAALWPTVGAFRVLLLWHLLWAGWGMARWMRAEGLGRGSALLAGIGLALSPRLIGHLALGHVSLVFAVAWTPWVLLATRRATQALLAGRAGWPGEAALAGAALGAVFLADPRWFPPCLLLGGGFAAACLRSGPPVASTSLHRRLPRAGLAVGSGALLGLGMAVPLLEYVGQSLRAGLAPEEQVAFSLPPAYLLGLVAPIYGGWPEWQAYVGPVLLGLAVLGVICRPRQTAFWLLVAAVSLLLALGSNGVLYPALTRLLPPMGLLRVPARLITIAYLGFLVLAAHGLDAGLSQGGWKGRWAGLGGVGVAGLAGALSAGLAVSGRTTAWWGVLVALALLAWYVWIRRGLSTSSLLVAGWIALMALDLLLMDGSLVEFRPEQAYVVERSALAARLAAPAGRWRVFSPSYSLPQQTAARYGLEMADGVHPLALRRYARALGEATGFRIQGYSVTLPPFPSGDPYEDWGPVLDAARLGQLNVAFVVSEYPLEAEGLTAEGLFDSAYVYRNQRWRPRAWVEGEGRVLGTAWTPNWIRVRVQGPGRLVLSEMVYPGWQVSVDGRAGEIEAVDGLLRSVVVSGGEHEVVFRFVPMSLYLGAFLSLVGAATTLWLWRRG